MGESLILIVSTFTIYFTCLKVTGQIDWSWWLVLSPIWIFLVLIMITGILLVRLSSLGGK